uniref:Uncharacterized protein n=2 Tax=Trichobilharzia regenti TaxID=157069 RepID=A0AA85J9Z0_TRIRE|nr:unnamed protein product [Trichobilharzia regenti]
MVAGVFVLGLWEQYITSHSMEHVMKYRNIDFALTKKPNLKLFHNITSHSMEHIMKYRNIVFALTKKPK